MPRASRTCAAAIWWDSMVASRRSTHIRFCAHWTASSSWWTSVTLRDLVVGGQLAAQLVAELGLGRLAHADHVGAHAGQRGHEAPLVLRERRLDEDDVHLRHCSEASRWSRRACKARRETRHPSLHRGSRRSLRDLLNRRTAHVPGRDAGAGGEVELGEHVADVVLDGALREASGGRRSRRCSAPRRPARRSRTRAG